MRPCQTVRMLGLWAMLGSLALLAGCDSAPCEEAADKLQTCLTNIDCRGQGADPTQPSCSQAQSVQQQVQQLRDAPCTAEVREIADQINKCPLDPGNFCRCP